MSFTQRPLRYRRSQEGSNLHSLAAITGFEPDKHANLAWLREVDHPGVEPGSRRVSDARPRPVSLRSMPPAATGAPGRVDGGSRTHVVEGLQSSVYPLRRLVLEISSTNASSAGYIRPYESGWQDSNLRLLPSEGITLARLSYTQ